MENLNGFVALAAVGLLLLCVVLLVLLLQRSRQGPSDTLTQRFDELQRAVERSDQMLREEMERNRKENALQTQQFREEVGGSVRAVGENVDKRLELLRDTVEQRLRNIQKENQQKLDEMRATVDEKLQSNLEKRLNESFKQVSERLEAVHKGLGEMQTLAGSVGDLKRVLTNVKSRGAFGETQLEALLEQTLASSQWSRQVQLKPGSAQRVDFAIRMPGAEADDGEPCWLPIDSKFPREDFERLLDANARGDHEAEQEAGRALEQRVISEARSVRDKYLHPPVTTNFALIFLPVEGLYAEVLRRPGLVERLQRDFQITLAGPTTLLALLNSLQMGFRTLAIQKRSAEVWKLLAAVKAEFGKFGGILDKVDKKLKEASNTIGKASSKSRNIERKLRGFEALPESEATRLLMIEDGEAEGESEAD